MTETCTYLRLKVSRSSLALSKSPTENVALPRKLLCKTRQRRKNTAGYMGKSISAASIESKNKTIQRHYWTTLFFFWSYNRCVTNRCQTLYVRNYFEPCHLTKQKCRILLTQGKWTYNLLYFSVSLSPSVSPFSQLWQHVYAAGMMWTGGVSTRELGHGEWGRGRAHQ